MSNERYLIVSYFVFAALCVGLGVLVYYILRRPFERMAEAITGKNSSVLLRRALMVTMTAASTLGFLGYSYNEKGCINYEQVIANRNSLVNANIEQVHGAALWIIWTLAAWGVVVCIGLAARRKKASSEKM